MKRGLKDGESRGITLSRQSHRRLELDSEQCKESGKMKERSSRGQARAAASPKARNATPSTCLPPSRCPTTSATADSPRKDSAQRPRLSPDGGEAGHGCGCETRGKDTKVVKY